MEWHAGDSRFAIRLGDRILLVVRTMKNGSTRNHFIEIRAREKFRCSSDERLRRARS